MYRLFLGVKTALASAVELLSLLQSFPGSKNVTTIFRIFTVSISCIVIVIELGLYGTQQILGYSTFLPVLKF